MRKEQQKRRGAPKGITKPPKRTLDAGFSERFRLALRVRQPPISIPQLARLVGCSKQVLYNYQHGNGSKKEVEALLLFKIADALCVAPRWLLMGVGLMQANRPVTHEGTPNQSVLLRLRKIIDDAL